jgi:dienelactone hydrolase
LLPSLITNDRLADSLARAGYFVVAPDFFRGDPAPADMVSPGFDFKAFNSRHPQSDIESILDTTVKHLREEKGVKKLASVGYCFGGKYVARLMAKGKGVDVGFVAHPSRLETSELKAISGPFTIAAAGKCCAAEMRTS